MKSMKIRICFPVIIALIIGCTAVDNRSMSKGTVSENSGKYTPPPDVEERMWERTKEVNTLEYYNYFIRDFPNSRFADIAREELKRFAKVTVTLPNKIPAGSHFGIVFTETNGVGVVFKKLNYTLRTVDGKTWTRKSPDLVQSDWVIVPANGEVKKLQHVPSEWGPSRVDGFYSGKDANGHNIEVKFSYGVTGK